MPNALILVADGSEEIEFVTVYDVLIRAGFEVTSVGVELKHEGYVHMTRNVKIIPDHFTLASITAPNAHDKYDMLILPGGGPGAHTFSTSDAVLDLIHDFRKAGKWIAAICAATTALVAAEKKHGDGVKMVTSHPSVAEDVKRAGWSYSEDSVVVDGRIITSRGPGTALLFSLCIVESVSGKEKADEVAGPMIMASSL